MTTEKRPQMAYPLSVPAAWEYVAASPGTHASELENRISRREPSSAPPRTAALTHCFGQSTAFPTSVRSRDPGEEKTPSSVGFAVAVGKGFRTSPKLARGADASWSWFASLIYSFISRYPPFRFLLFCFARGSQSG